MKIGIDLRFLKDDDVSNFVIEIVNGIIEKKTDFLFTIYGNKNIEEKIKKAKFKNIDIKNGGLKEQIIFNKILKKENNNYMIFFNHFKPVFYKKPYITFCLSLKDIYYTNFNSYIEKYKFYYLIEKNLKNSEKIICLDQNTQKELIEKFDINENKINIINGFFPKIDYIEKNDEKNIDVNIKNKYAIKNDYFIYSGGDSIEKNYEKLIFVFKKLKEDGKVFDLVILGNNISKNITLRNIIIEYKMQENIFFLGSLSEKEIKHIYKNSLGVLFPSFYEPFPFKLTRALHYDSNILASNIKNIKDIFGDEITYFSPISTSNIYECISSFSKKKKNIKNYKNIKINFNKEKTLNQLLEIIK